MIKKIPGLIILFFLIFSPSLAYGAVVDYGALEDPYDNADFIQVFNETRLNTTYGATELNVSVSVPQNRYEDFINDWNEVDAGGLLSQTVNRSTWANLERDTDNTYLGNDTGAQTLSEFTHEFDFNVTANNDNMVVRARCMILAYSTILGDRVAVKDAGAEEIGIRLSQNQTAPVKMDLQLEELENTNSWKGNKSLPLDPFTEFYCTIEKYGTGVKLKIFNNSARTVLHCAITHTLQNNQTYRYIMAPQSQDANFKVNDACSGYLELLWLGDIIPGGSDYVNWGNYYHEDLNQSGLLGQVVAVQTNSSLNNGAITIELSDDNSTWGNTKTLTGGFETWESRDFTYSGSFFIRVNMTLGDTTPRLYELIVITNQGQGNGASSMPQYLLIGLAIGVLLAIFYIKR